jgi:replication-associated recombination protein RarA
MSLLEKYRPRKLSDLLGQEWVAHQLELFAAAPYPCAFLFDGDTGTGKTSAAMLLAEALGVCLAEGPFGGLHQIASGEQSGQTVREMMRGLRSRPFFGSGWQVLVVNEADAMTASASIIWLDALEDLPPMTVVVFTTNAAGKIPARLRDRCERLTFEASAMLLRPALQEMTDRVWREEGCPGSAPEVEALDVFDGGNASFRRLLQALTPRVRAALAGPGPAVPVAAPSTPPAADDPDRLHSFGRRWAAGEKLGALAREHGSLTWQQLCGKLWTLGYRKGVRP